MRAQQAIRRARLLLAAMMMLAGCTTLVEPSATVVTNAGGYFWPLSNATYRFTDNAGAARTLSTSVDSGRLVLSDALDPNNRIFFTANLGDIDMQGVTSQSFFPLPAHTDFFSKYDTVMSHVMTIHPLALIAPESSLLLLGTDSGSIFHCEVANHIDSCFGDGGPTGTQVFGTASKSTSTPLTVYAGTMSLGIWQRNTVGVTSTWTNISYNLASGAILAVMGNRVGNLYASVAGSGLWSLSGNTWSSIASFTSESVNSLYSPQNSDVVLAGTSLGRVGIIRPTGAISWSAPLSTVAQSQSIQCFGAWPSGPYVYAGTHASGLFLSTDGGTHWTPLTSGPTLQDVKSICSTISSSPRLFVLTGGIAGGLYEISTSGAPSLVKNFRNGVGMVAQKYVSDSLLVLSQDYGLLTVYVGSATNVTLHPGDFARTIFDDTPGPLVLLKSTMTKGTRWRAGTLMQKPTDGTRVSYPIYAQVIDQLDSLQLSSATFKDVMVVRYAFERSENQPVTDSLPYWVMYFANGLGPVMLEEVRSTSGAAPQVIYRLSE